MSLIAIYSKNNAQYFLAVFFVKEKQLYRPPPPLLDLRMERWKIFKTSPGRCGKFHRFTTIWQTTARSFSQPCKTGLSSRIDCIGISPDKIIHLCCRSSLNPSQRVTKIDQCQLISNVKTEHLFKILMLITGKTPLTPTFFCSGFGN